MKGYKISIATARELAISLFEMETECICQDPDSHFEANNWFYKYGDSCIKFEEQLTSDKDNQYNSVYIEKVAQALKLDFATGWWIPTEEDIKNNSFYNYMMPTEYGGWICKALEMQLADLTGVGTQLQMSI